jgi:hypothetical protein
MTVLKDLRSAVVGWYELLRARARGAARFNATRAGLINALLSYVLVVIVTLVVQGSMGLLASVSDVAISAAVNVLPLLGLSLAIVLTLAALRLELSFPTLAVPAIYAMAFVLLIQLPLSLWTGGLFSNAILAVLAFMLYREAREVGKMSIGVSIAFAALCIIALVALPSGLYMLLVPAVPPA